MNKAQQAKFNKLYKQHLSALRRQGKSDNTIDSYSRPVRRITEHFDRSPDTLTKKQLEQYFNYLIDHYSWSTIKTDRNGLQFFYKHVLNKQWDWINIVKPPQRKSLPVLLSIEEIAQVIRSTREARYQVFILTTYTLGLRLSETLNLTVKDIDAANGYVLIRQAKGRKDRRVTLPSTTLLALRQYWLTHRNPKLLFPSGKTPDERRRAKTPMNRGGCHTSFKMIVSSCKIPKNVSIHTLRHCYGTHMLEQGANLRAIQIEMGHESPNTTARYTQYTKGVQQNCAHHMDVLIAQLKFVMDGEV